MHLRRSLAYAFATGVLLLTGAASQSPAQPRRPPFTLQIANDMPDRAGSDIFIRITLHNVSHHVVNCSTLMTGSTDMGYDYIVRDSAGHRLKPRFAASSGEWWLCKLRPGKTLSGEYLISSLFDLNRPGTYTVQISRLIDDHPRDVVKSNVIAIDVTK